MSNVVSGIVSSVRPVISVLHVAIKKFVRYGILAYLTPIYHKAVQKIRAKRSQKDRRELKV